MTRFRFLAAFAAIIALVGGVVCWKLGHDQAHPPSPELEGLSRTLIDPVEATETHASVTPFASLENGDVEVDPGSLTELQRHNRSGILAMERDDFEAAVGHFEDALGVGAGNEILLLNMSRALAKWGQAELRSGDSSQAILFLERAATVHRDGGENASLLARALMRTGRRDRARGILDVALINFPECVSALRLKAELSFLDGELELAVASLQKAQSLAPSNSSITARLEFFVKEQSMLESFLRVRSTRFDCMFDAANLEVQPYLQQLLLDLEAASDSVNALLGLQPNDRLLVLLLSPEDYIEGAPNWSNGLYDGRIRVPFEAYEKDGNTLQATFRHEYTHAALHRVGQTVPTWLHEGLAQLVEGRDWQRSRQQLLNVADSAPSLLELQGEWSKYSDRNQVRAAYAYSLSLTQWMIEEFGRDSLAVLIQRMGSASFETAFEDVFGRSFEQVDSQHRSEILRESL